MRKVAPRVLTMLAVLWLARPAAAATYYLDPAPGADSNPGTQTSPWKTLVKVRGSVSPGDTVNVVANPAGQPYTPDQYKGETDVPYWTDADGHGTAQAPITIQANPGDSVTFDGGGQYYW